MAEHILTDAEVEFFETIWLECPDAETAEDVHSIIIWGRSWQDEAQAQRERAERAEVDRDSWRRLARDDSPYCEVHQ